MSPPGEHERLCPELRAARTITGLTTELTFFYLSKQHPGVPRRAAVPRCPLVQGVCPRREAEQELNGDDSRKEDHVSDNGRPLPGLVKQHSAGGGRELHGRHAAEVRCAGVVI